MASSIDMSGMLEDESEGRAKVQEIVKEKTGREISAEEAEQVRDLAVTVVVRSARLVTASFVGIIWQLSGEGGVQKQHIAVDGSVYEKMPFVKENIMRALSELLGEEAAKVDTVLDNGGSGLGAALAAAMSQE
jgi:hexokinase